MGAVSRISDRFVDDRQPPANLELEQVMLGTVLAKEIGYEVISEIIDERHFKDELHRRIWKVAAGLVGKGKRAGPAAVKTFLGDEIAEGVPTMPYLAALCVKADVNLAEMREDARLLKDLWVRRQLMAIGKEVADLAYNPPVESTTDVMLSEVDEALDPLRTMGGATGPGLTSLADAIRAAAQTASDVFKGGVAGLSTGFTRLDPALGNMQPGDLVIIGGRPGSGKAQPLGAKILTPTGWTTMGQIKVGDEIASVDGAPSFVSGVFPQGKKEIYRVAFSDGRSTLACAEHLWKVRYRDWEEDRILTTARVAEMLQCVRYRNRLSIDQIDGTFGADLGDIPVDPWLLGVLIGNGHLCKGSPHVSTTEPEILARIERILSTKFRLVRLAEGKGDFRIVHKASQYEKGRCGVRPNDLTEALKELGLCGCLSYDKFIPARYLTAQKEVRLELLRGLIDTDGSVSTCGGMEYSTSSERLANDVVNLVRSLGGLAHLARRQTYFVYNGERKRGAPSFRISIRHENGHELASLARKSERAVRGRNSSVRLNFSSIERVCRAEAQCISVTHPSSLYVTDDYIVTHNTSLALNVACSVTRALHRQAAAGEQGCVGFFSLEMTAEQLGARILAEQTGVPTWRTRLGRISEDELTRYVSAQRDTEGEIQDLLNSRLFEIDERSGLSLAQVARQCREWKKRKGLKLVVIDYLQLMGGPPGRRREANRVHEIGEITMGLKNLAKELRVPIILLSQLSREVEKRDSKRPIMADLRDSGSIEQDADAILLVYREEYYLRQEEPEEGTAVREEWEKRLARCAGLAEVIVAKSRHGVAQTVLLGFDGPRTCFLPEPVMENRPPPEESRSQRRDRPKTVTADGSIMFGALTKATREKSVVASKEQLAADSMLMKGARLIPKEHAVHEFAKEIGVGTDDKDLPKRFSEAFRSIRKNGDARFTGDEDAGYFLWLPSMTVEALMADERPKPKKARRTPQEKAAREQARRAEADAKKLEQRREQKKRDLTGAMVPYDERTAHGGRNYSVQVDRGDRRAFVDNFAACFPERKDRTEARVLAWAAFAEHYRAVTLGEIKNPSYERGVDCSGSSPGHVAEARLAAIKADRDLKAWVGSGHDLLVAVIHLGYSLAEIGSTSRERAKHIASIAERATKEDKDKAEKFAADCLANAARLERDAFAIVLDRAAAFFRAGGYRLPEGSIERMESHLEALARAGGRKFTYALARTMVLEDGATVRTLQNQFGLSYREAYTVHANIRSAKTETLVRWNETTAARGKRGKPYLG